MLCRGICVICIAAAQNWTHLMVLRGLQGFFECTISPGFVLVVSSWYRVEEHASRQLFWQSANAAWRAISLFLGAATLILAIASFALLGSPKEVRWMNKEETRMAGRGQQVTEAFKDPHLYFCCFNAFLSSVPNGGLSVFGSLMNKSFGFTNLQVLLMDIPRSVVSVLLFLVIGIYTRRVANKRMYIMACGTIPPLIGFLAMALLPDTPEYKWIKRGMYLMTVPVMLALFLGWTPAQQQPYWQTIFAPQSHPTSPGAQRKPSSPPPPSSVTARATNMCGSQICKSVDAPRYVPGTISCSTCFGLQSLLICAWRVWYMWRNRRRRDRATAASGLSREEQEREGRAMGERNYTDLENPHFRCTM